MRALTIVSILAAVACDSTPSGGALDAAAQPDASGNEGDASPVETRCEDLAVQPLDSQWTIRSSDMDRIADVHVPASYDPTRPTPVVLNFHGFSSDAAQQAFISRMKAKSDLEGFIAVHATGVGLTNSWNGGACCGTAADTNVDDVAMVGDLLDEMGRRLCVDSKRVYSTGLSNGGFLSHRLACELADRIAAIAPVAGVLGIETCTPSRPVPVLHFHGTSDGLVPYEGGGLTAFISVDETIATWASNNSCGASAVSYDVGDTLCETASGCAGGADVTLCTIDQGGHTWPGGVAIPGLGKTTMDISATDAMWDFFVAHPLP